MTATQLATTQAASAPSPITGLNALKPRILYTSYFVADIARSLTFYRDVLGMQELQRFNLGEGVQEVMLRFPDSKGAGVILMWNTNRTSAYEYGDSYSRFVLMVSDLDAAMAHLVANGVMITKQATDVDTMRYCMIQDPDAYSIEVLQLKCPAAA